MTWISRSRGSSSRRDRSSPSGMLTASGTCSTASSTVLAHVEQESVLRGVPVAHGHVAAQHAGGDHPGEVDRILRAAERRRVAELALLEVVHGRAQLDRQRELADPLVDAVLADRLRSEHASVGLAEQDLHRDRLGARVVARRASSDRGRPSRSRCHRGARASSRWRRSRRPSSRTARRPRCPGCRGSASRARRSRRPRSGPGGSPARRARSGSTRR